MLISDYLRNNNLLDPLFYNESEQAEVLEFFDFLIDLTKQDILSYYCPHTEEVLEMDRGFKNELFGNLCKNQSLPISYIKDKVEQGTFKLDHLSLIVASSLQDGMFDDHLDYFIETAEELTFNSEYEKMIFLAQNKRTENLDLFYRSLSQYKYLPLEFMEEHIENLDIRTLFVFQLVNEEFIEKYEHLIPISIEQTGTRTFEHNFYWDRGDNVELPFQTGFYLSKNNSIDMSLKIKYMRRDGVIGSEGENDVLDTSAKDSAIRKQDEYENDLNELEQLI
jgi:hypothetical protein